MSGKINCPQHGTQHLAVVCQHTIESLYDSLPRGLWVATDKSGDINAYCNECEVYRNRSGGDWPSDCDNILKVKILCLECFALVRKINGYEVQ